MNTRMPALVARATADTPRINHAVIGLMRIAAGLLWLANLNWKRPPDFGRHQKNGLYKYVDGAVTHEVFPPWSWFVENVVLKNYTLCGWSTLLLESALAALLLLGLWTRPVALLGAANSVAIALSVLYYPNEWPWSYYLMVALHLVLFATAAGQFVGLDGVRSAGDAARRRAILVLGSVAVVVGIVSLIVVSGRDFTAHQGKLVGWERGELQLFWFNPLSALLTAALGAVAIVAVRVRRAELAWVAVAGFAAMAMQVIIQWRYRGGNWTGGFLGGTGPNLALWAMFAIGIAACRPTSATKAS
jgi:uncharacterized membrane protein YphA (DoxX/SURF4 family)